MSNPWGTAETTKEVAKEAVKNNPFEAAPAAANTWNPSADTSAVDEVHNTLMKPFQKEWFPFDDWIEGGLTWVVDNFREFFQAIRYPIDITLTTIENSLLSIPPVVVIIFMALLAWQVSGKKLSIGTLISLVIIGAIGAWDQAMVTLALVFTSMIFCVFIGIPIGIYISKSKRASAIVRPVLDAMQTTPAFVYLIPIVMLFGIGNVPGVVVTIVFALPPLVRLTDLGIKQVPSDLVEAADSFGASRWQLLFRVQLPVALPTIMAGVNQTLMLSLSMVVFASMIAVGGLGQMVLRGIGRLDMGLSAVGGLGIVLLAVVLDRMTQSFATKQRTTIHTHWYETGPAGIIYKLINKVKS